MSWSEDAGKWQHASIAGRQRAESFYAIPVMGERYLTLIRDLESGQHALPKRRAGYFISLLSLLLKPPGESSLETAQDGERK